MRENEDAPLDVRVRVPWTSERGAAVLGRIGRVARRRQIVRRVAVGGGALSLVAVVTLLTLFHDDHPAGSPVARSDEGSAQAVRPVSPPRPVTPPAPVPPPGERHLRFRDGSLATLQSPETVLEIVSASDDRIVNRLVAGSVRFEITKRPSRLFRVQAGETAVEVLGTTFQLDREEARLRVHVTEGRVRVSWPGGRRELATGETGTFPPEDAATPPGFPSSGDEQRPQRLERPERPPVSRAIAIRSPSRRPGPKSVIAASRELSVAAPTEPKDEAEAARMPPPDASPAGGTGEGPGITGRAGTASLAGAPRREDALSAMLRQADEARAGGRSVDAASALRAAAAAGDRTDPRVPLAEFRLGRLLLEDLGKPREAAAAFAHVRELAPSSALAPDALAREVQALAASGDTAQARARAREYLAKYPRGSHAVWVRRWGLLD
jgi:transmembrane sensor